MEMICCDGLWGICRKVRISSVNDSRNALDTGTDMTFCPLFSLKFVVSYGVIAYWEYKGIIGFIYF
jgi:hypothetical protein